SLAFCVATAFFGGLSPAISSALVKLTGDKISPGWLLMCAALCGLAESAMLFVRLSRGYIAADNKA
ncbi:citrate-proton symporter, partial [Salmonella enterica subsp. enterica serovar Oslo]|nr:citrate-proton symporter [Salmonella enterica subsp. enterica serovar Oslo]